MLQSQGVFFLSDRHAAAARHAAIAKFRATRQRHQEEREHHEQTLATNSDSASMSTNSSDSTSDSDSDSSGLTYGSSEASPSPPQTPDLGISSPSPSPQPTRSKPTLCPPQLRNPVIFTHPNMTLRSYQKKRDQYQHCLDMATRLGSRSSPQMLGGCRAAVEYYDEKAKAVQAEFDREREKVEHELWMRRRAEYLEHMKRFEERRRRRRNHYFMLCDKGALWN